MLGTANEIAIDCSMHPLSGHWRNWEAAGGRGGGESD
jgi:hypothetical protein